MDVGTTTGENADFSTVDVVNVGVDKMGLCFRFEHLFNAHAQRRYD